MKFRLKVKVNSRRWMVGMVVYDNMAQAEDRIQELEAKGIKAIVVDEFGGKLK